MMFFLLLSVLLLMKKRVGWGIFILFLSIGIKYATAIALLPCSDVLIHHYKKWKISSRRVFAILTISMLSIFFLSSLREEIYPWYFIWVLLPSTFLLGNNLLTWINITFSFSLLLRYIPFMLLGTYFGPTPFIKFVLMTIPVGVAICAYFLTQKNKPTLLSIVT